ncbi:Splicing factor U2af subunit [Carex littledalei]|uniref:Splicing factor U2af subunit n=1 Tax=Carex littledalei TaxID=544730 RepID=A0A833QFA8_9POAL|nr:Splicing factor U2af subunit [Carex littledalei]
MEKDRGNCPFYLKTGACRHGNGCRQLHNRPTISRTLLLSNMYQRPDMIITPDIAQLDKSLQKHFENFYIDIFEELSKYGEIESLNVCDNLANHMIGNVYVQFCNEEQAEAAMRGLKGRYYNGRPIIVDYTPVTDFFGATCRRLHWNRCNMRGFCNYIHAKKIRDDLGKELYGRSGRSYSWSRGWSSSYRRDRSESIEIRSHERVDHRRNSDRKRRTRSEGRRSRSPSYRRDREISRERSHEFKR